MKSGSGKVLSLHFDIDAIFKVVQGTEYPIGDKQLQLRPIFKLDSFTPGAPILKTFVSF